MAELYPEVEPEVLRRRYPNLDPDAVRRALRRTSYDSQQEREAETVATIILEWASVLNRVAQPATTDAAQRLDTALGDRWGWL
ncbi:hypothetical protein GCM10012275_22850 [Longimycelium tulufanense]|uniref:Uncharacterized protein n=1 Tax=Longimycelium tulufanense TaxID=907463 RepID=A0A8J3C7U2_9PSEU|nr:hypothetical protein GCM10012275_22850 [Longimycelium tulufanense]